MSITITGTGITNDTANSLVLKNNTSTTLKTIDTSGRVLLANKPSFRGYPTAGHGTGSIWSSYTMAHNSTGSGFNASTGRFTAPVSGTYSLSMWGISSGNASNIRYAMMKNGNTSATHCITYASGGNHGVENVTNLWYLSAGDYVECTTYQDGTTHGGDWNGFSGALIG